MSEFTGKQQERNDRLISFCLRIINADNPVGAVRSNQDLIDTIDYKEVIWVVDELVKRNIPMEQLKTGVNKIINLLFKTLNSYPDLSLKENGFLDFMVKNNTGMELLLKELRPLIKQINKTGQDEDLKKSLLGKFKKLYRYDGFYVIKENVLFPALEKHWKDYRCLQVMWSFHDDIRRNLKMNIELLQQKEVDIKLFNRLSGDIFFNMLAIKFREEKILFPLILQTIPDEELDSMLQESLAFDWPLIKPDPKKVSHEVKAVQNEQGQIDLNTGILSPEQICLMMNHLPVDITYVDENNKVCYFSTPSKRIFPRTHAIIGRDVRNCHPKESVHVVDEIVESFRSGKKQKAQFWIKMKGEKILIQYFALRDQSGNYKGVIEVSQEISEIQELKGEKRLLDWVETND